MIDVHAHILPGIDDGPETMSDALRMARSACDSGVSRLIVTPHSNIRGIFENYYEDTLIHHFHNFEAELIKENINLQVMLGMEVYATEEVPELLQKGRLTTLNQSRYLLLEFGFHEDILFIDFLIKELMHRGIVPVIAHPERYPYIQKHPDMIYRWLELGCSIQINKGSIMGSFGFRARDTALYLLEYHLVSMIASDAHSPSLRTTELTGIYSYLKSRYSEAYATLLLHDNPERVIENRDLIQPQWLKEWRMSYYL